MTLRLDRTLLDRALAEASTTRQVVLGTGVLGDVGRLVADAYPRRPALIVADERTFDLAGRAALASLQDAGHPALEPVIFPAEPTLRPDYQHVESVRTMLQPSTVAVAVGSGTINDLTKRAAGEARLPYVVVATAASMDGYTASGAALVRQGVKQTFDCPAPEAVIADLDMLCQAPPSMTASGYGDLVGKVTAGADWLLADALGIEPIIPDVWQMVQGPLRGIIADPDRFARADAEAVEQLFLGLVVTGLAIQAAGSTRCASGSEHQFSHLWEMRGLEYQGQLVSHGAKVGLGSITSAALYERLLDRDLGQLDVDRAVGIRPSLGEIEAEIRRTHELPSLVEKALEECRAKYVSPEVLRARLTLLRERWPHLRARLREQLLTASDLRDVLARAGCPTEPEQVGLTRDELRRSYAAAGQIRRRYTVFDLAEETGLRDCLVDELFASGGYWSAGVPQAV